MSQYSKRLTPFECYMADSFAEKIVGNIDSRDFMDGQNSRRSMEKLFEDSSKGKKAEIFILNALGSSGVKATTDFDIYEEGIGDDGDVVANGMSIDVKASSPRARLLMIEKKRVEIWDSTGKSPDCLCLVSVDGNLCTYKFGCGYGSFRENAVLIERGEMIPNTGTKLKASNYIIREDQCSSKIRNLVIFMRKTV